MKQFLQKTRVYGINGGEDRCYATSTDHGYCIVQIPEIITIADVAELREYFALVLLQAERRAR